ncbi:GTPase-associated system all-helical protein GASH [uncultured Brevundimonas sp.]|uniref:GTPase-associated system all-helical protein GASH n=1 Tax=uncultured Brevundimonas sp. TaxID=213418 RepID=UPI0025D9940F|nr:GTPase-associated system all-helical protein GASH [uncultured Brevundimonas sp.]
MDNLAVHMRITGLTVSNDDVDSRRAAATKLAAAWRKLSDPRQIVDKAAAIAAALGGDGTASDALASEVEAAVQKTASAFLAAERPLEVGVCAGMAAVAIIEAAPSKNGWTIADVYANALWLALSFQPALADDKREKLRLEVLALAREQSLNSANAARERDVVPEPAEFTVTWNDDDSTATTNFNQALEKTVGALRRNAALDREELDFLWWAQLSRSRALGRALTTIAEPVRLVAAGIEGAALLRRLPADVHREIVLRTLEADPKLSLGELLAALGEDRQALTAQVPAGAWSDAPSVFPLLNGLASGAAPATDAARSASDWGARALLEAGLAKMMAKGKIDL